MTNMVIYGEHDNNIILQLKHSCMFDDENENMKSVDLCVVDYRGDTISVLLTINKDGIYHWDGVESWLEIDKDKENRIKYIKGYC